LNSVNSKLSDIPATDILIQLGKFQKEFTVVNYSKEKKILPWVSD
jgi:hypothetical protein